MRVKFKYQAELLSLLAGGLTTLAFAPFGIWPLALVGPALLFHLWLGRDRRATFRLGLLYGLGFMGSGVTWLHVSIAQFGNVGWLLPILVTLVFVLIMALYYGLVSWLGGLFQGAERLRLLAVYPALWVLGEWLRGWLFTGFPWLLLGHTQIDTPLAGFGPIVGALGISWAVALSAGLMVVLFNHGRVRWSAAGGLLLIWGFSPMMPALTQDPNTNSGAAVP